MPPRVDPKDWDRLFRPNAPRRGGPLRALANVLMISVAALLLGGAAFFGLRYGLENARERASATQVAVATSNAQVIATRTARALDATATVLAAAAVASTPTAAPEQVLGRGSVLAGGNLRSEPLVADTTVIGQICPGDKIDFLEQASGADGGVWFRIRLTEAGANCTPQRVTVGSLGWASASLLSPPAP